MSLYFYLEITVLYDNKLDPPIRTPFDVNPLTAQPLSDVHVFYIRTHLSQCYYSQLTFGRLDADILESVSVGYW